MNIFSLPALGKEGLRLIKGCSDKDQEDRVSQVLLFSRERPRQFSGESMGLWSDLNPLSDQVV